MKKYILGIFLSVSTATYASTPVELQSLLPKGKSALRAEGLTFDRHKCLVSITMFNTENQFYASVDQIDAVGYPIVRHSTNFQLGFGHVLVKLQQKNNLLYAVETHKAEESYSSDSKNTLSVLKVGNVIKYVEIKSESKGFFGYTIDAHERCIIN